MKVNIDENKCIGCGICASKCPEGIEIVNGKASIKDENAGCLGNAAKVCPREAITFESKETDFGNETKIDRGGGFGSGRGRGRRYGRGRRKGRRNW